MFFSKPILIFDNNCILCYKFAIRVQSLSKYRIQIIGHFDKSCKIKSIFPSDYDPTSMFWLINKHGTWGGRSAIIPLIKEILYGIIHGNKSYSTDISYINTCNNNTCETFSETVKRIISVFQNSKSFH